MLTRSLQSDYLRSYSYYCNRHAEGIAWLASAVKKSKELAQFVNVCA